MQPDYPESVPQPDLANVNNAPYAPAVKQKAVKQMLEQVSEDNNPHTAHDCYACRMRLYVPPCHSQCSIIAQRNMHSIAMASILKPLQAEGQIGECMLYTLAEWAKEQLADWLEESVVERSQPSASNASETAATPTQAKEVRWSESQLQIMTSQCTILSEQHHDCHVAAYTSG